MNEKFKKHEMECVPFDVPVAYNPKDEPNLIIQNITPEPN